MKQTGSPANVTLARRSILPSSVVYFTAPEPTRRQMHIHLFVSNSDTFESELSQIRTTSPTRSLPGHQDADAAFQTAIHS